MRIRESTETSRLETKRERDGLTEEELRRLIYLQKTKETKWARKELEKAGLM